MAKRSRTKHREEAASAAPGEVGPRQPCPCGSGKRYKACHGGSGEVWVARPFVGLAFECDLVAMRELVPAATAPLPLTGAYADRDVVLCSLLPGAAPAMVRDSGEVWLGLQVQHSFGDPSRELASVLERALATEESGIVPVLEAPGPGPRLQDLVTDAPLEVTVRDGFGYWIADVEEDATLAAALEQADAAAHPSARLEGLDAAYWTHIGTKEHLRWVRPEPEDDLLTALARLHAAGEDRLVPDSRFVGMFRAHGLLVPVWDLPVGTGAEAVTASAQAFDRALADALADTSDLTAEQRSAKEGLATRQVTLR